MIGAVQVLPDDNVDAYRNLGQIVTLTEGGHLRSRNGTITVADIRIPTGRPRSTPSEPPLAVTPVHEVDSQILDAARRDGYPVDELPPGVYVDGYVLPRGATAELIMPLPATQPGQSRYRRLCRPYGGSWTVYYYPDNTNWDIADFDTVDDAMNAFLTGDAFTD